MGVIGAVRNYSIKALARVGQIITTKVDIVEEVFGMTLADAEVRCGEQLLATAEIKLSVRNSQ